MSYLRLRRTGLNPLHEVVNRRVDKVETALFIDVQRRFCRAFLKESAHILHELIEVEMDADRALQLIQIVLFKEQVVSLLR